MKQPRDIATRADCQDMARAFYERAFTDDQLGPVFVDIAQLDLESHLPRITDFWETVLLGARTYDGGAFRVHWDLHVKVPLTRELFDRWVEIWHATVDERFSGPIADDAKFRGSRVADAFSSRLAYLDAHGVERA